jgi:hypothetical protein
MSIFDLLEFDSVSNFIRLAREYGNGSKMEFCCNTREHFRILKEKDRSYLNHTDVLAVSIGGTNTKLMITSMCKGKLIIKHLVTMQNPTENISFYDYLDNLIVNDGTVLNNLMESPNPSLGFSVPVLLIDGVPYHMSKLSNIEGFVSKNIGRRTENITLADNLKRYFESRRIKLPAIYCQMDAMMAHLGCVTVNSIPEDERSILLVCGTGLSTADEEYDMPMGMLEILDENEQLYPADLTENHQLQYSTSGKGLYLIMKRIIGLRSLEEGSALLEYKDYLMECFKEPHDSALVIKIWESTYDSTKMLKEDQLNDINLKIGQEGYKELQLISTKIMNRVTASMANCILTAAVKNIQRFGPIKHNVFLEGSIANNLNVASSVASELKRRANDRKIFSTAGIPKPKLSKIYLPEDSFNALCKNSTSKIVSQLDYSLIGAAASVIADNILKGNKF